MYERFDELDSNMFGQGELLCLPTQICESNRSNSQKQLLVCDRC